MTEPAMPIREESRKAVTAAKAPASICTHEISWKKRFNLYPLPLRSAS